MSSGTGDSVGKGRAIKTCKKCRADYGDEMKFCPQCGGQLVPSGIGPGDVVGSAYRVVGRMGQGWAGEVFEAEHAMMGRYTALKIITSAAVSQQGFVGRFRSAARHLADLAGPAIATVHDMGLDGSHRIYIASELVRGRNLGTLLAEGGPLAPQHMLDIILPVVEALVVAHEAGLVHGSMKPGNVVVPDDASMPKVVDFAARRIVAALQDDEFTTATPYGKICGEVAYLAPEQITGGEIDARTDIYSLGLVMYELLTGLKPHAAESPAELARAQIEEKPESPRKVKAGLRIPKFIDRAVMRAIAKNPNKRQSSAAELLEELQAEIVHEEVPAEEKTKLLQAAQAAQAEASADTRAMETVSEPTGPRLVFYKGNEIVAVYPLDKDELLVGRSSECDIPLEYRSISREHARIYQKGDRVMVEDLESLNGTYINDNAVKRGHIEHKDVVAFGSVELIFRTD